MGCARLRQIRQIPALTLQLWSGTKAGSRVRDSLVLRFILNIFGWLFSAATIGAVFVVMILGAVFWMYGRDLPDHQALASYEPATISRVYSINGQVMDEFAHERRMFTPADEIPDIVKFAFVSAEDKHFYEHKGYDIQGIIKAGLDAAQGGRLRGASTITQQVMKNFLLDGSRSFERKIKEIILASRLETTLSKDQILELYLNEIFLGQNSYGVTAAADTYFGKNLEELTPGKLRIWPACRNRRQTDTPFDSARMLCFGATIRCV